MSGIVRCYKWCTHLDSYPAAIHETVEVVIDPHTFQPHTIYYAAAVEPDCETCDRSPTLEEVEGDEEESWKLCRNCADAVARLEGQFCVLEQQAADLATVIAMARRANKFKHVATTGTEVTLAPRGPSEESRDMLEASFSWMTDLTVFTDTPVLVYEEVSVRDGVCVYNVVPPYEWSLEGLAAMRCRPCQDLDDVCNRLDSQRYTLRRELADVEACLAAAAQASEFRTIPADDADPNPDG